MLGSALSRIISYPKAMKCVLRNMIGSLGKVQATEIAMAGLSSFRSFRNGRQAS